MDKKFLCHRWEQKLAEWAIPETIAKRTPKSPWILRPEKFAPVEQRNLTPTLQKLRELLGAASSGKRSLLDIGCGAGGVSLLLLDLLDSLTVVDESRVMLEALQSHIAHESQAEIRFSVAEGRWPEVAAGAGTAQVVTCANVLFNVPQPCGFIEALNRAAVSSVVLEVNEKHPHFEANKAWKHFWNIDRPLGPSALDLVEIVEAMGYSPMTETFCRDRPGVWEVDDDLVRSIAQRICLDESKETELRKFLEENPIERPQFRTIWWEKEK